jgi:two-component system chemotaxis sensor kinase CheA
MVPLKQMFDRLARMVRKISQELEKEIHFVISGAETEVDKLITEELSDPLMHLIRNAIDHGVEEKEVRLKSGKPQFGTVALTAYQKGSHVVIEVEDDGIGIDEARLLEVALERGLIDADQAAAMSQREIMNLVFLPGVSTSKKTTEISGRGVGMDVVKNNIASLGGVIEAQSERNIGTRFSITLPTTLAIIPALLVGIQEITYAIPLNTVGEAIFISQDDICPMFGRDTIAPRGETLVLCHLSDFFGIKRYESRLSESCVVVTKIGQRKLGLVVDILYGQQDVVIKSLGSSLNKAVFFSGATDIGEEKLALVIDTSAIIDEFFSGSSGVYLEPSVHQPEIT